ncbi:MAG TPA: adenylate/guanylate cyclase domain-containing protein, partial [Acidimicrobiales bacterium]|nr:adenylate/guanylate cyclase domain-containing protein [Acidimicrobiales bacterium]
MGRPSGEVTFCFTDIEASTALLNDLGLERYERVLGEHRTLLRNAFMGGGVEVYTEGDGMLFAWQEADDALRACAAGQRALADHDWPFGVVVRVRMGLHTGEAVATADGDYIGLAVHQASRIGAAANGAQILVSPETVGAAGDALPHGWELHELGEFHVRDFATPLQLRELRAVDAPGVRTPPRVAIAAPRNFAAVPTSFVGRDEDVEALRALVRVHPLVTIVGPGGVGKTRLAREVARRSTGAFVDGVWLVELE